MSVAAAVLLAIAVTAAWLGAAALLRLPALARVHAVAFVNVAAGGAVTLATWVSEGPTPRTAKILLAWIIMLLAGALSSHVTGRAIQVRGGGRR